MSLKLIERKIVHRGRRIDIEELTFEEDGRRFVREVGRHVGAVCVVAVNNQDDVVLIRNRREAADGTLWELPAGTLEPPEPPADCAKRELIEEAGFEAATVEHLTTFWTSPGLWDEQMHAYLATGLTHVGTSLELGEVIEPHVVPIDEALAMIERGDIVDGKSIAALLYVAQFRR